MFDAERYNRALLSEKPTRQALIDEHRKVSTKVVTDMYLNEELVTSMRDNVSQF